MAVSELPVYTPGAVDLKEFMQMLDAKLVIVGGELETREVRLRLPMVFGRGRDVDLTLAHPLVSRRHCEIFESDGKLVVRDLESLNGTFIGSERINEQVLEPGQLLTIGTVTFRAVYGDFVEDSTSANGRPEVSGSAVRDTIRDSRKEKDETVHVNDIANSTTEVENTCDERVESAMNRTEPLLDDDALNEFLQAPK